MILQALHDFAIREQLTGDLDYQWIPIAYEVMVGRDGKLLGIRNLKAVPEGEESKKKPRKVAPARAMPRESGRTSGDRAFFLYDKAEYVFGIDPDGNRPAEKLAIRSRLFRERVRQAFAATGDEALGGAVAFLDRVASGEQEIELDEEVASNDLFALYFEDEESPISSRPRVRAYWKELRQAEGGDERPCLVTGRPALPADKHTILKYIPGASTAGIPLVSFNANAFESYGLKGNDNALISRDAAEIFAAGLQRLLHPAPVRPGDGAKLVKQNWRLSGDTTVVYWTSEKHRIVGLFSKILEGRTDEVANLLRSPHDGRQATTVEPARFYALILSGAQGRAIIRGWFESTVAELQANLARHFADLELVRNTPKPKNRDLPTHLSLRVLLQSLAPPGKSEGVPPAMASQLLEAAMRGTLYPISILQRAIQRFRAEIGRSDWADFERRDARAALIKAVLNRRIRQQSPDLANPLPEVNVDMDPENTQPGYLLGRLMAVLERLQQLALGDINASVIDRYFSAASATPRAVFVRLLKGARHHAKKAKDEPKSEGFARSLEKQIDQISDRFDVKNNGFPAHLSLEQQGLFVLGYHQQRHAFFQKKEKKEPSPEVDSSVD